jgi:hypothetical protein
MLTEIGAENNTTTLIMLPSDFTNLAKQWTDVLANGNKVQAQPIPQNEIVSVEPLDQPISFNRVSKVTSEQ